MRFARCQFMGGILAAGVLGTLTAQQGPNSLIHSIPPPVGRQSNAQLGSSVAVDGAYAVVGAPNDDLSAHFSGAVKVFVYIYGHVPSPGDTDDDGLVDSWELAYWPTTAWHGALDDFDADGYSELLELAFGLNPTLPDAGGMPPIIDEGGYLTMTLTKHPGVSYEVQTARTLVPAQTNSFSATSTTVLIDTATTLKVRDNYLIGKSPARFMRVKVAREGSQATGGSGWLRRSGKAARA